MLYRSDITSFFIDFFVLNELTRTPLQKIPSNLQKDIEQSSKRYRAIYKKISSNPQKDIEQSTKRYRAIRKKIPTSKIKTTKLVESLAVFRFPTVYLKHCSPLNFAINKQFLFFLRNGKTNQHLFGKGFQVVRKCALCPLQHSAQQRYCILYRSGCAPKG